MASLLKTLIMLSFSDIVAMSLSCDERRWRQQRFLEYRALLAATQWLVSTISCFFFLLVQTNCLQNLQVVIPDNFAETFANCSSGQLLNQMSFQTIFLQIVTTFFD